MQRRFSYYTIIDGVAQWLYDSSWDPEQEALWRRTKEEFDIPHYSDVPGIRVLVIDGTPDTLDEYGMWPCILTWDEKKRHWKNRCDFSY